MISPDTFRRLDRVIGVPACALLTAVRRACALTAPRRPVGRALRRALFVQLAESGSMVLADPAMRDLIARSGAEPYCVTFAHNRGSLAIAGTIADANVFAIRTGSVRELVADVWRFLGWVRRMRIDAIIDLELFSRLSAVLCMLTGVVRRAGFHRFDGNGPYRGDLYSSPVAFDARLHMAQNYLLLARALGEPPRSPAPPAELADLAPRRVIDRAAAARARAVVAARLPDGLPAGSPLVLINANASAMLPQRRWPPARFVALARRLLGRFPELRVLLIGAAEDRDCAGAIVAEVADRRCADVAGLFAMAELPALFGLAAVMVSNDSGPAHFASVTALPVVALFGPETPVLFRPLGNATVISAGLPCSPCVSVNNQRRSRCRDNQCMQRITVDEVFDATVAVLEARHAFGGMARAARDVEAVEA